MDNQLSQNPYLRKLPHQEQSDATKKFIHTNKVLTSGNVLIRLSPTNWTIILEYRGGKDTYCVSNCYLAPVKPPEIFIDGVNRFVVTDN